MVLEFDEGFDELGGRKDEDIVDLAELGEHLEKVIIGYLVGVYSGL